MRQKDNSGHFYGPNGVQTRGSLSSPGVVTRGTGFCVKIKGLWPALISLALILISTGAIYVRAIRLDVPLFWDEQGHALAGLKLYHDLARGDVVSVAWDTYDSVFYPPLFYWLEAVAFTLLGPSKVAARLVSLVAFAALGLALLAAGRKLRDDGSLWVGVIAFGCVAVSIPLAQVVGQAMLESAGLTMMMIAVWAYLDAVRRGGWRRWVLAGLLIVLTYLTRPQFGVVLLIGILLNEAVHLGSQVWSGHHQRTAFAPQSLMPLLAFLAPLLIFGLLWFSSAQRIRIATGYAFLLGVRRAGDLSLAELLRVPASLGELAGSWFLMVLLLVAGGLATWRWRDRQQRVLVLLVVVQFLMVELSPNEQLRYQLRYTFPILPPLGLLAGYWIVEVVRRGSSRYRWLPLAAGLLLALTFVVHEGILVRDIRPWDDVPTGAILDWIDGQIRRNGPTLILSANEVIHPQPTLVDWHLVVESRLMDLAGADTVYPYGAWFANGVIRRLSRIGLEDLGRQLAARSQQTREPAPGQTRTRYLELNSRPEGPKTSAELATWLKPHVEQDGLKNVIVLVAEEVERRYSANFYDTALTSLGFKVSSDNIFPEGSVRALAYRRP